MSNRNSIRAGLLSLALTSMGTVTAATTSSIESCRSAPLASLTLEARNGALLVPVTVQDATGYMVLRMSAALSAISRQAAERLAIPVTHYSDSALGARGEKLKTFASVSSLAIGGMQVPPQELVIDPDSDQARLYASPDVVGALGMDLLHSLDIELDVANRKLLLYAPGQCGGKVVQWSDHADVVPLQRSPNGSIYFSTTLDGRKLETAFSTTNSITTISTDLAKRVYGIDRTTPGLVTVTGADGNVLFARVMQLTASTLTLGDEKVFLLDPPKDCMLARKPDGIGYDYCFGAYPLLLGLNVLAKLHVYIDTRNNLLYFTRNE